MPIMSTFIPAGRTIDRTDLEVPHDEFIEILAKAKEIDKKNGINHSGPLPYLGGVPCTQCSKASMYVNVLGDIYDCPGQLKNYGNIINISLKEAFNKVKAEQSNFDFGCPPRIEYWKRTGQLK